MLPQTEGESFSLVAIGAGLAALGIALRRRVARAS
jgi:LPXTG-motif cell wall-anchored protein